MKLFVATLMMLALPALAQEPAPQAAEDREALRAQAREMRARAQDMRDAAESEYATAEAACWKKFLVAACQQEALDRQRAQQQEAKRLEIEAGRIERRVAALEREEKAVRHAEKMREREAKSIRRAEEIRRHEEEALARQAKKQAEIERRQQKRSQ